MIVRLFAKKMYYRQYQEKLEKKLIFLKEASIDKDSFGGNFKNYDLVEKNLIGGYFPDCNFCHCNLQKAKFQRAILNNSQLDDAKLALANLADANLYIASLVNSDLSGVNLSRVNLRYANLQHADLQDAILLNTDLQGANLYRANLAGAIFDRTNLYRARNVNLTGAYLDDFSIDTDGLTCINNSQLFNYFHQQNYDFSTPRI